MRGRLGRVSPDGQRDRHDGRSQKQPQEPECLEPAIIGRIAMVEKVAEGVRRAMAEAGITDPADVHYVQTKTPLLTIETIREAKSRGQDTYYDEPHGSMDLSNGTTALGVALALGEIETPRQEQVMRDLSLFSAVASCSSGVELDRAQIVVVGNARGHGGTYRIGHSVMKDALDQDGIWNAIRDAGLELPERPHPTDLGDRLVNVFLKCEADPTGYVRGRRNAMLDDSDVFWHRQIKATVGGVAASVTGDPAVFVSVAAVHQGPSGGGPVAAIVRASGLDEDADRVAVALVQLADALADVLERDDLADRAGQVQPAGGDQVDQGADVLVLVAEVAQRLLAQQVEHHRRAERWAPDRSCPTPTSRPPGRSISRPCSKVDFRPTASNATSSMCPLVSSATFACRSGSRSPARGRRRRRGPAPDLLVDVEGEDRVRADQPRELHDVRADAADAPHPDGLADAHLAGVHHGAERRGDGVGEDRGLVHRHVVGHPGEAERLRDRVLGPARRRRRRPSAGCSRTRRSGP